jgi:uncharacterized protein with HEPN domain
MPSPDAIRLRHMREAVASALEMADGRQRPDLTANMMLAMALARCLEILGEAASQVTPEVRVRFSGIPFAKMVSMRNHLIHAYFDMDLDIVWTTVADDLPSLLPVLDSALVEIDA